MYILLHTVEDQIEPIAVCDDDLHISVGGDGIGYITDADVDEGSWDNCELTGRWISRKLADELVRRGWCQRHWLSDRGLADESRPL